MCDYTQALNAIDSDDFHGDEVTRISTLRAARSLVHRLEKPWERICNLYFEEVCFSFRLPLVWKVAKTVIAAHTHCT